MTRTRLVEYLGQPKRRDRAAARPDAVGVANGLAWTSVGGELLEVEVAAMPGSGKVEMTGRLGDVMQESVRAAMTFVRAHGHMLGIGNTVFKDMDIHVHVPEGAVPKDGPSAGITMGHGHCQRPVRHPGEGRPGHDRRDQPAGQCDCHRRPKGKAVGSRAQRHYPGGDPLENKGDLDDVPQEVKDALHIIYVKNAMEVLHAALTHMPAPKDSYTPVASHPAAAQGSMVMRDTDR